MSYVLLEDGARFDGEACGADGPVTGEVVFNTAMSGYQESLTDPSYARQLITFTYPHIGNYGVSAAAMESDRIQARGAIIRDARDGGQAPGAEGGFLGWLSDRGVPAITGVDTRALVRHIRDAGAMRGGIFPDSIAEDEAMSRVGAETPMAGLDLAREVTPNEVIELAPTSGQEVATIAVLDTGVKASIVANLRARGARLRLYPCASDAEVVLGDSPDAVFLANGPGDPAALDYIVEQLRRLVGCAPVFGICLGHQLLCRAVGLDTYKLPFGHRGANHPVKDLLTGRIEITSQNHGFAVLGPAGEDKVAGEEPVRWQTDFGAAELTHINLYDRTVEGLRLCDVPGWTVQYHPEAGPGPHDAVHLFDRLIGELAAGRAGSHDTDSEALSAVRRMIETVIEGGPEAVLERYDDFYTDDMIWRPAMVGGVEGRIYRGRDEFARYWQDFTDNLGVPRFDRLDYRALGPGRVLVTGHLTIHGRRSGVTLDQEMAWLFELRGGRVAEMRSFLSPADAEAAIDA